MQKEETDLRQRRVLRCALTGCSPHYLLPDQQGLVGSRPWNAEIRMSNVKEPETTVTPCFSEPPCFVIRNSALATLQRDVAEVFADPTFFERRATSQFPVRENYPDPKALGELVLADLTKVINENWPEGSQPDPLDREAMDHEAYAQSRERVYIGRQEYFDRLDAYASGAAADSPPSPPSEGGEGRGEVGNQPLVILGESGSGKSALLANWVARYRQAHPDALVLQHYIGATPYSADWAAMLRRLMGEFKRRLGIQQDIPDQPDALRSAFPNWLYMADAKVRSPMFGVPRSCGPDRLKAELQTNPSPVLRTPSPHPMGRGTG